MRTCLLVAALLLVVAQAYPQSPCPTADDTTVQGLLDAAAAQGGGTVQLEARVYQTCMPLIIGSNVSLRGAGRGATIIRGSNFFPGSIVNGTEVDSSIASVGARNVSVSDLTLDHLTNDRNANGISFLPSNFNSGSEILTTNGLIERVEILGASDFHNYMIWNLKGQHIKIAGNWVDGNTNSSSDQEGIESYGGYDVLIAGNTVQNIGDACINIGSAGAAGTEVVGLFAVDNYLSGCTKGIGLGTSSDNGDQTNAHVHVRGNVIIGSREAGIDVAVVPGTHERDLEISHNTIRNVGPGTLAFPSVGIELRASDGPIGTGAIVTNTIETNHIDSVRGANAHGIRLLSYPNARILNNTIVDTDGEGIWAVDSSDIEIAGNRIERPGYTAIVVALGDISRLLVERNRIADWPGLSPGIVILGANVGALRDNTFKRSDNALPTPILFDSVSCGVTVTGNLPLYQTNLQNLSTPSCGSSLTTEIRQTLTVGSAEEMLKAALRKLWVQAGASQ